jgi:hypothetical protein
MVVGGAQTITGALTWTHSIRKESKESPVSSLLSLPFFPCIFLDFLFVSVPEKEEEEEHTAASGVVVVVRVRPVGVNI